MKAEETALLTTALLSLGAVLAWEIAEPVHEVPPCFAWEEAECITDDGKRLYLIESSPEHWPKTKVKVFYFFKEDGLPDGERTRPDSRLPMPEHWYNSVAEAKAACEVHALTGQFPPGMPSVKLPANPAQEQQGSNE